MFEATIESNTLKEFISALEILSDDVEIAINQEGISSKIVDNAHTMMVDAKLSKEAFSSYKADNSRIRILAEKLIDICRSTKPSEPISLTANAETLTINYNNITRKMPALPIDGHDPKIPTLSLPGLATLNSDTLKLALKAADSVSEELLISLSPEHLIFKAESEEDVVELKMPKAILQAHECVQAVKSNFPMSLLKLIAHVIEGDRPIRLLLGSDYPLNLSYNLAADKGEVTYLVAPRIAGE